MPFFPQVVLFCKRRTHLFPIVVVSQSRACDGRNMTYWDDFSTHGPRKLTQDSGFVWWHSPRHVCAATHQPFPQHMLFIGVRQTILPKHDVKQPSGDGYDLPSVPLKFGPSCHQYQDNSTPPVVNLSWPMLHHHYRSGVVIT